MATYGEKIRKYEARVRKAQELGVPPRQKDVDRLMYYVGRAEKKGDDHETKLKDKVKKRVGQATKVAGAAGKVAIKAGVAALAGPAGAAGVASSSLLERAQKMLKAPAAEVELDEADDNDVD